MEKIKCIIVDDDLFWQENIAELLNVHSDIVVVQILSTKDEALEADLRGVDVVLLDIGLSKNGLEGIEVAKYYSERGFENIIMLTTFNEDYIIADAFECGAMNYITKSSCADLPKFVRDIYSGNVSLHSDVSRTMIQQYRNERKLKVLTPTEREVFDLQQKGMNKAQISDVLYKSVETIKKQIRTIKQKLSI